METTNNVEKPFMAFFGELAIEIMRRPSPTGDAELARLIKESFEATVANKSKGKTP